MEQDNIKSQLLSWLNRKSPKGFARIIDNLPISIASDVGLIRAQNQDKAILIRAQVSQNKAFLVGILCDGMGGMTEGERCASLAIASFVSNCIKFRKLDIKSRLLKAVHQSNQDVYDEYGSSGGATLSAFIFDSDGNSVAINVGDSRIYCVHNEKLEQLSTDDTIAGQFNNANNSELSNKLLQYIGMGSELEPHIIELPTTETIQKLILTSDGVHYLPEETFKSLVLQNISEFELSKRLINVSKWCGGHDNATTIVLSNPSQLFSYETLINTGVIQVCDFNNDAYLIGIEKATTEENTPVVKETPPESKHIKEQVLNPQTEINDKKPDKAIGSETKKKKRKQVDKTKEKNSNEDLSKPQLRIDFDD